MDDEELANVALDAACNIIQTYLGVTTGDFASRFFSDGEVLQKFIEYIKMQREEIK